MKRKREISKDKEELITKIVHDSGPAIREHLKKAGLDVHSDIIGTADFLVAVTVGINLALEWLEKHEKL